MTYYFERDVLRCVERFEKALWEIIHLCDDSSVFVDRIKGVGYITRRDVANFGITGPAMRGCGVDYDIRRDDPYDAYDQIDFEVPVLKEGDAYSRYQIRIEEMFQSCSIIKQALQALEKIPKTAPYRLKVPSTIPEGTHMARIEDPRGEGLTWPTTRPPASPDRNNGSVLRDSQGTVWPGCRQTPPCRWPSDNAVPGRKKHHSPWDSVLRV